MRPIDADRLIDLWKCIDPATTVHPDSVIGSIARATTVDMYPLGHAHWIGDDYDHFSCSNCGFEFDWPDYKTEFCPCCGAKMYEE